MAFRSTRGTTPALTTLVLEGGDAGLRPLFELRFLHGRRTAKRARHTLQEVHEMGIEDQAKGKLDEAKGRAEQAQGDLTGDQDKKNEGLIDEAKGKVRQAADHAKEAIHDLRK
jgi:uncharacterized protein YjbJ (UPF0337 family)